MEQVIVNLVVNARDAMPRGGRLTVSTSDVEGATVALVVRDTGCGMNEETRSRAFEPFFTTKPVGEGTGLGLSTVYGIVKQSDGEVLLRAHGRGNERSPSTSADRSALEHGGFERRVATLVPARDHSPRRVRSDGPGAVRDVLLEAGYTVLEARNGMEALEIACRHAERIHLMVTDVVMPGMAGGELVRRMALTRPEVKVLYVSGYTDDVLVRRGVIESGVNFLQKPACPTTCPASSATILG